MSVFNLNPGQKKAVVSTDNPLVLHAGAGSGKTRVLIERELHILKNEPSTSLRNMATITFTNKASDEIAQRLQEALFQYCQQNPGNAKIQAQVSLCETAPISTIHEFCANLLRQHGRTIGVSNSFIVRSYKHQLREFATEHINAVMDEPILQDVPEHTLLRMIETLLDEVSGKGIAVDEALLTATFNTASNDFYNAFKPLFLQLCIKTAQDIATLKIQENALTPDDLIALAVQLLDNPPVLVNVAQTYPYIFVDEYQNTCYRQFLILQKLINARVKAFIIGDKKQSIYSFRGADVQNTDRMDALAQHTEKISLDINYRTDPALLEKINNIFEHDFTYKNQPLHFPRQALKSGRTKDVFPEPLRLIYEQSIVQIINEITNTHYIDNMPVFYNNIAILARNNYELELAAQQLKKADIPVEIMGGKRFYRTMEIVDTFKLLYALIYPSLSTMLEAQNTFYFRAQMLSEDGHSFNDVMADLQQVLKCNPVDNVLTAIYESFHAMDYLRHLKQYQAVANLEKLVDIAREMAQDVFKPTEFVEFLDRVITQSVEEDEAEVCDDDHVMGIVSLYTIHKAKGLEFPVVIILNCDENLVRNRTSPKIIFKNDDELRLAFDPEWLPYTDREYYKLAQQRTMLALEEELRIFYVACTRAQNMLILASRQKKERALAGFGVSWVKWVVEAMER